MTVSVNCQVLVKTLQLRKPPGIYILIFLYNLYSYSNNTLKEIAGTGILLGQKLVSTT